MRARRRYSFVGGSALLGALFSVYLGCVQAQDQRVKTPDGPAPSDSSVLEMIHECDTLAAHPNDPQRMSEGVSDDRIVPRLAIAACQQALKEYPDDPRFAFQLGRAQLAAGRKDASTQSFLAASKKGYAAGWAYAGDVFQERKEYQEAYDAYGKAMEGGFERAKALREMMIFEPKLYALDVVAQLYDGNVSVIASRSKDKQRTETRSYVYAVTQKFMGECDQVIAPGSVVALFQYRYGGSNDAEAEDSLTTGAHAAAAEYDAQAFLKRHGCDSPVARQLFEAIEKLIKMPS